MINYAKSFKSMLLSLVLASTASHIQAQIAGKETDKTYGNTTIVYRDSNANDAQVLAKLEAEMGMGDVVRITDAPVPRNTSFATAPKPAVPRNPGFANTPVPDAKLGFRETARETARETPAFDTPEPKPVQQLVAASDVPAALVIQSVGSAENAPQAQTSPANTAIQETKTAAKQASTPSKANAARQTARETKVATKSVTKTGKLYKPRKASPVGKWFKGLHFGFSKKSKYGCYKF